MAPDPHTTWLMRLQCTVEAQSAAEAHRLQIDLCRLIAEFVWAVPTQPTEAGRRTGFYEQSFTFTLDLHPKGHPRDRLEDIVATLGSTWDRGVDDSSWYRRHWVGHLLPDRLALSALWFAAIEVITVQQDYENTVRNAFFWCDVPCAEQLLAQGLAVDDLTGNGTTPLITACSSPATTDYMRVVTLLLAHGCDVNRQDLHGRTALHAAVFKPVELLTVLLAAGADVHRTDADGMTPLLRAASNRNRAAVRILVAHGADVNARTPTGATARMLAREAKRVPDNAAPELRPYDEQQRDVFIALLETLGADPE
jgi:hypothetical protein